LLLRADASLLQASSSLLRADSLLLQAGSACTGGAEPPPVRAEFSAGGAEPPPVRAEFSAHGGMGVDDARLRWMDFEARSKASSSLARDIAHTPPASN